MDVKLFGMSASQKLREYFRVPSKELNKLLELVEDLEFEHMELLEKVNAHDICVNSHEIKCSPIIVQTP